MAYSMMTIFDPSSFGVSLPFKWVSSCFFLLFVTGGFWVVDSGVKLFMVSSLMKLSSGFKEMFKDWKQHCLVLSGLFTLVFLMNLTGLLPFSFSSSAHLSWGLTICLPLWAGGLIFHFKTNAESALAHFLPLGAPLMLSPFLVIVEIVSLIIRPMSLSVRLMANITAGHMILSLLESIMLSNLMVEFVALPVMVGFLTFELGVALIQAYVFMSLISLYWEEND